MLVYRKDTPRLWPRYPRVMKRLAPLALAAAAATAACNTGEPPSLARLDLSPVLDSIFVGDSAPARSATYYDDHGTFVGPVAPAWSSTAPGVVDVDPATGRVAGLAQGGPLRFYVHANTLVDSGAVQVVNLTDTTGGLSYYTILGTFLRRTTVGARAVNYARAGDTLTFRLRDFITFTGQTIEAIVLTSRDPVIAPTTITIDSISPSQAFDRASGFDAICHPLSNWGLWSTRAVNPPVSALSRQGGTLVINQVKTITNGKVVSGWFSFVAQRTDVYDDPIWALPIRGTFVAPLITDPSPCIS